MPTLYVENVPEEIYDALRARGQANGKSISAEVLSLLAENVATPSELARRRKLVNRARKLRSQKSPGPGPFASAEQMQREDRSR